MNFTYTESPIPAAANFLAKTLAPKLTAGQKVLWLLSGGSSLDIAIATERLLAGLNLSNLSISLTDERYGPIGHPDENWQMLLESGLSSPGANLYRPLNGTQRAQAAEAFNAWLEAELQATDYKIGIFGMGPDGHTAGIKPHSPAVWSPNLVADFVADDFERITITPAAIKKLDAAVVQISGQNKVEQLNNLLDCDLTLDNQPAQILKAIPNLTIFSDIKR